MRRLLGIPIVRIWPACAMKRELGIAIIRGRKMGQADSWPDALRDPNIAAHCYRSQAGCENTGGRSEFPEILTHDFLINYPSLFGPVTPFCYVQIFDDAVAQLEDHLGY